MLEELWNWIVSNAGMFIGASITGIIGLIIAIIDKYSKPLDTHVQEKDSDIKSLQTIVEENQKLKDIYKDEFVEIEKKRSKDKEEHNKQICKVKEQMGRLEERVKYLEKTEIKYNKLCQYTAKNWGIGLIDLQGWDSEIVQDIKNIKNNEDMIK